MKTLTAFILLMFSFVAHAQMGGNGISGGVGSPASLANSNPQSFSGPLTSPKINGEITVDGKTYTTLAAAYSAASTASATSDQTIRLGPGTFTISSSLVDPDNGHCINLYGSGQNTTIIRATATMTAMYSKGTATKPTRCNIQDLTWDANGFATNGLNIQTAKGWTIERNKFIRIATGGEAIVLGTGSFGGATLVYETKVLNNTCAFEQADYPTNNFPGTVTTPLNCIHAYGTAYDNTYAFNVGWNHQHAGIVTTGGDGQIIGNHFYTSPVTGAQIFFSAYDLDLGGSDVVMGNTFDTYGTAGIFFNGDNINVKGNIFECTAGATYCTGLFAGVTNSSQDNITFTDNQITGICGLTEFSVATPVNWNTNYKPSAHSSMHDNVGTDCNNTKLQFHQGFAAAFNNVGGASANAGWNVQTPFTGTPALVANAITSQTGDLFQATDVSNNPLWRITVQGWTIGQATAPTGVCPNIGAWVFSQDGHATFCPSSGGTWVTKI